MGRYLFRIKDKMEFEIKTIDGEFIRLKKVLAVHTPNKDNCYIFRFETLNSKYIFPINVIKYCKEICS